MGWEGSRLVRDAMTTKYVNLELIYIPLYIYIYTVYTRFMCSRVDRQKQEKADDNEDVYDEEEDEDDDDDDDYNGVTCWTLKSRDPRNLVFARAFKYHKSLNQKEF